MIPNSSSPAPVSSVATRVQLARYIKRRALQVARVLGCAGLLVAPALAQTASPLVLPNTFKTAAGSSNGASGNTGFTVGQPCSPGSPNKATDIYGDGCLATQAAFGTDLQDGVRVDGQGNIFIADINNNWSGSSVQLLRKVDAQTGIISLVASSTDSVCKLATTTTAGAMDKPGAGCPFLNGQAQKERGWGIDPYGNVFSGNYASGSVRIYCNAVSPLCPIPAGVTQTYSVAQKQVGYMYRIAGCVGSGSAATASAASPLAGGAGDGYFASAFWNLPGDVAAWGPSNPAFPSAANITGNTGTCGTTTGEFNGGRAVTADLYGNVYLHDGGNTRTRVIVGPPTFTLANGNVLTNPLPAVIALNPVYKTVTAAQMYGRVYPINGGFTATVANTACPGAATATAVDAFGDGCPWYNSTQSNANPVGLAVDQTVEGGVASPNPIFIDGNLAGLRVLYMGPTVSVSNITAASYPMAHAIFVNNPALTSVTQGFTYLLAGNSTGAMTTAPSLGTLTSMSGYGRVSSAPNGNLFIAKASNTAAAVAFYDLSTGYVRLLLQSTGTVTGSAAIVPAANPPVPIAIYTCPTVGAGDGQPAFATSSDFSGAAPSTSYCFNNAGTGSSTLSISVDARNNLFLGDVEIDAAGYGRSRVREVLASQLPATPIGTPITQSLYLHGPAGTTAGATALSAALLNASPSEINVGVPTCATTAGADSTVDCLAAVTFAPSAPGPRSGNLLLTGSAGSSNTAIAGFATGSALVTDPTSPILPLTANLVAAKTVPVGVAVDSKGDVFTMDTAAGKFTEVSAGVTTQLPGTLPTSPSQLAIDPAGNLYGAGIGSATLAKLTLTGSTYTPSSVTIGGVAAPQAVTFDSAGNLYVADKTTSTVYKVTAATLAGSSVPSITGVLPTATPPTPVATGLGNPTSLAIDSFGNLYIGDTGAGSIFRIDGISGALSTFISSIHPVSVAVDAAGDVYYQDSSTFNVVEIPYAGIVNGGAGALSVTVLGSLTKPSGLAIAGNGNAYSADSGTGALTLVARNAFAYDFGTGSAGSATVAAALTDAGNLAVTGTTPNVNTSNLVVASSGSYGCSISNGVFGPQAAGSACTFTANFVGLGNGPVISNITYLPAATTTGSLTLSGTLTSISGTTTSLANLSPTVLPGTTITLTATVASTAAVSNQPVTFLNGATVLGTATTNASGVATFQLTAGPFGTLYNFQATFAGTSTIGASASPVQVVLVALTPSTITLALSSNSSYPSQAVTFTATQTPAAVGQTISFLSGSTVLGTGVINSAGVATYVFTPTKGGTYTITASFASDGKSYAASVSAAQVLTVSNAALLVSASPDALNLSPGATGQITLSLTPQGGFTGLINLSCSSPVKYVTCGLQFTSVSTQQGIFNPSATVTVAYTTIALARTGNGTLLALLTPFGVLAFLIGTRKRNYVPRLAIIALLALCGGILTAGVSGCGNGTTTAAGPAPSGTKVVTFSATAGGATQTTTVTVNIH